MLKQSKGIIYVQGKETKDATLIGLAYMDKVELKNKKIMKTIEEVKEYFKDAKEVKCLSDELIYDLTKVSINKWVHEFNKGIWIDAEIESKNILLCENGKFAEIISYKKNKPEFEHLEEIEVAYDKDDWIERKYKFIGYDSKGRIVVEADNCDIYKYNYARKIKHERNKAIETIKELMKVNDIKKDEL